MCHDRQEVTHITILYGLATMLVVFGHSHPLHAEYPEVLARLTGFVYTFHMPLFFCISGVLIVHTANGRNIWTWWKNKARKLAMPYIVLTLAAWIPKTMLGSYMNDDMEISIINAMRIIFVPRNGIWGHFWFIPVYLIQALIAACFWKGLGKVKSGWIKICVWGGTLIIATLFSVCPAQVKWFGGEDICKNFVYVLLGMYLSEAVVAKRIFNIKMGALAFVVSAVAYYLCDSEIVEWIISFAMIYMAVSLSIELSWYGCRWIKYIGEHAFTIYIYSWPVQAVAEMGLVVVLKLEWSVSYLVMFVAGLAGPLLIYELYTRKMRRNTFLDAMIGVK